MATPASERDPALRTLEQVCKAYHTTIAEIAGFMEETGFLERVLDSKTFLIGSATTAYGAILKNANDSTRVDQMVWIVALMRLAGHPGVKDLEDLLPA